jgi:hypothetical protein
LLVTITARKALHLVRDEHRQKRGGGELGDPGDWAAGAASVDRVCQVD